MIDLRITPEGENQSDAYVLLVELMKGIKRIYVGRNLDVVEPWFKDGLSILPSGLFNSQRDYYERNCENIISHETLHIVLYDIKGEYTTRCLDNIDIPPHNSILLGAEE